MVARFRDLFLGVALKPALITFYRKDLDDGGPDGGPRSLVPATTGGLDHYWACSLEWASRAPRLVKPASQVEQM